MAEAANRNEVLDTLSGLFRSIGERGAQQRDQGGGDVALGGLVGQVEEFVTMPMDLAVLFLDMSVDLAELVLTTLEQAGFVLVKGMTPL